MCCSCTLMTKDICHPEKSVNFYKTTRHHTPDLSSSVMNQCPRHRSTLAALLVQASKDSLTSLRRGRYDSQVSYRLVGRSKKPVASYERRTLSFLPIRVSVGSLRLRQRPQHDRISGVSKLIIVYKIQTV